MRTCRGFAEVPGSRQGPGNADPFGRQVRGTDKYLRKLVFENELFPWKEVYFQHFGDMPLEVDFGNDLGVAFQKLFVEFPLPPLRQQGIANVETILRGKDEEEKHRDEIVLRMIQTLVPLTGV